MAHPDDSPALTSQRVLALCGSLRAESVNRALLEALVKVAPDITIFAGLSELPLFNPDDEEQNIPAVAALRRALQAADAVVISCPEYAHGIPGAFKNALDWVVGSAEFDGKSTLLLCASARSLHAPVQLAEVLRTMGAKLTGPLVIDLPMNLAKAEAALAQAAPQQQLREVLAQFKC